MVKSLFGWHGLSPVPLGYITQNDSQGGTLKHDLEIIAISQGHKKSQESPYGQAENNSPKKVVYFFGKKTNQETRDKALKRGTDNDRNHLVPCFRCENRGQGTVHSAQYAPQNQSQDPLVHRLSPNCVCLFDSRVL